MINEHVAVKAIPEEHDVLLVFEVDVGSREHVRVQAVERDKARGAAEQPAGAGGAHPQRGRAPTWSRWRRTRSSRAQAGAAGAPPAAPW